ncbi:MAG: cytochrome c family protein [Rhodospirillales bacterium]|nr:cytochrome c family protein [Rhodospirillales bacterium]
MTFAGLSSPKDRAAVIRFLAANTEAPPPFPAPAPKAAAPEAAKTAAVEAPAAPAAAPAAAADIKTLLASADPAAGEKVFGKCKACHNAENGGPNQVGPNLWGVVGRPIAHHEGFNYSAALSAKNGETWTYEELNTFITSPKAFVPGTKMTFPGLPKPEDRANVIAFLRTKADSPVPLP